ncbi:MAG: hypothetical protein KVP17_000872 [Porospora cf. gigantea B]|uniref:uncharacterized protein n=1 Tax=Porospora cf. gigantea B TaxID=2853592 RepID=UPI003571BD8F|nr:MAG: hypothetical protein KVP17_000872 [Porospora cf. gigantea B]
MLRAISVSETSLHLVLCSSGSLEALGGELFWRSYKLPQTTSAPSNLAADLDYQNLLSVCPRLPLSTRLPTSLQLNLQRRVSSLYPIFTAHIVSNDQHHGSVGTVSFVPIEHSERFTFAELMAREWSTLRVNIAPLLYEFVCDSMVVQVFEREDVEADAVIRRSASEFRRLFLDLAIALRELHATGFAHGNLKPGVFYRRKDGGFSLAEAPCKSTTLAFSAPELLLGTKKPSVDADVWALGVTVLSLILGEDVMLRLASKVDQSLDTFCSLSRVRLKYLQNYMEQKINNLSEACKRSSVMQQICLALRGCLQIHREDRLNAADLVPLLLDAENARTLRALTFDSELLTPTGLGVPMYHVGCSDINILHSLRCILEGLTFLHGKGVMVRSMSPASVRLHESQWKISDLRHAKKANWATQIVGEEEFRAPEMVFRVGPYNNKVDVYSAAATVIAWAVGTTPGASTPPTALLEAIIREGREEQLPIILRHLQCDIYSSLCLMETELALDKATLRPLVNLLGLMLHFDPVKRRPPSSCLLGLHDIVTKSSHAMVS